MDENNSEIQIGALLALGGVAGAAVAIRAAQAMYQAFGDAFISGIGFTIMAGAFLFWAVARWIGGDK